MAPSTTAEVGRAEAWWSAIIALVMAGALVVHAHLRGALGISRNDDWAFLRIAHRFGTEGVFELNGWAQMMLVGQTVLAWPIVRLFGPDIAPLQIGTAVLTALGLWAAYLVVRALLPRGWASLTVACLALGPVYAGLSVSFMTDGPAFALQMLCLLAGQRALRDAIPSLVWFAASLALALVAFGVREYGVAAGLAVVLLVVVRSHRDRTRLTRSVVAIVALWCVLLLAMFVWRSGLEYSTPTEVAVSAGAVRDDIGRLTRALLTLALFVVPAAAAISPIRLGRRLVERARSGRIPLGRALAVVPVVAVAGIEAATGRVELGNYFTRTGSYSVTVAGPAPSILPEWVWGLLAWVALAVVVMVASIWVLAGGDRRVVGPAGSRWTRVQRAAAEPTALMAVFTLLTVGAAVAATMLTTAPYFDRYLLTLVPFTAALIIGAGRRGALLGRWAWLSAGSALAVLAIIGAVFVDASAAFDGARWRLATAVTELGVAPETIDGGFEWFGYHQSDPAERRPTPEGRNFWIGLFSERPVCATSRRGSPPIDPLPGAEVEPTVLAEVTVRSLLVPEYGIVAMAGPQRCGT